jgi:hypothetical protein
MATLDSDLLQAIKEENLNEVRRFLDGGGNPNAQDKYGNTALKEATAKCNRAIVELLLERGADPNFQGTSESGMGILGTALHTICGMIIKPRCYEIAEILIRAGIDVNSVNTIKNTPLHNAAQRGNQMMILILLKNGANPNVKNNSEITPLLEASRYGHFESVKLLLEAGADANSADDEKITPLHKAARGGHIDICKLLVKMGANLELEDKWGNTPFHTVVDINTMHYREREELNISDMIKSLQVLYDLGANPLHTNKKGNTPLQTATSIFREQSEITRFVKRIDEEYRQKIAESRGLASLAAASQFPNYRPGTVPMRPLPNTALQGIANFLGVKNKLGPLKKGATTENRERFRQQEANRNTRLAAARQAVSEQHAAKKAEILSKAAKEGWYGFMGGARQRRKTRGKRKGGRTAKKKQTK